MAPSPGASKLFGNSPLTINLSAAGSFGKLFYESGKKPALPVTIP
jgi:hypothetical protein